MLEYNSTSLTEYKSLTNCNSVEEFFFVQIQYIYRLHINNDRAHIIEHSFGILKPSDYLSKILCSPLTFSLSFIAHFKFLLGKCRLAFSLLQSRPENSLIQVKLFFLEVASNCNIKKVDPTLTSMLGSYFCSLFWVLCIAILLTVWCKYSNC